jgi:pyruvate-formate lyase-activating enzyme
MNQSISNHHQNQGLRLPEIPQPIEIEIEFTNVCNARCRACPREDMPQFGFININTLDKILDAYLKEQDNYQINQIIGRNDFPRVTVAGGGDPFIHNDAIKLLRHIINRGFQTILITNSSRLTPEGINELVQLKLSGICVSFWGIKKEEYEAAMKLPYEKTLNNVEKLAQLAKDNDLSFRILWVRVPEIISTDEEIKTFWNEKGIEVEMTDNYMWNRGGLMPLPQNQPVPDILELPDLRRRVWCSDLFFSDSYNWQGDCLLCCCNYFTSKAYKLGNINTHTPKDISQKKYEIFKNRPLPSMCQVCQQPRQLQSKWMAEPWLKYLDSEEISMVTYDPNWKSD